MKIVPSTVHNPVDQLQMQLEFNNNTNGKKRNGPLTHLLTMRTTGQSIAHDSLDPWIGLKQQRIRSTHRLTALRLVGCLSEFSTHNQLVRSSSLRRNLLRESCRLLSRWYLSHLAHRKFNRLC